MGDMETQDTNDITYEAPQVEVVGTIADVTGGRSLSGSHDSLFCFGASAG
jgi:hypothetical protein